MSKGPGKLRNKSSRQVAALLQHYGFILKKPGPHEHWWKRDSLAEKRVIVPARRQSIAPKTLSSILEQAGISKDEARQFWSRGKSGRHKGN
jgi:predicted RNA binding protein YcfA (HicA-like mRNA interferase family)